MKIILVVGARPNFMKAGPIIKAVREHNRRTDKPREEIRLVLVHTGQHYDQAMSGSFFNDLDLPRPDVHLGVGSGSHAVQTAEVMRQFESVVLAERPDAVVVVGDVNSTLACALVAAKISFDSKGTRPLIAHVEAGLRSYDKGMPEEVNRIVTDHVCDLLFVTEQSGADNLLREGTSPAQIHFVGNTMIDSLLASKARADESAILERFGLRNGRVDQTEQYALLTLHRPSNVDDRETFVNILEGLRDLSQSMPVVFPVHPRTRKRIAEFHLDGALDGIHLVDPLGYLDFLCLMKNAQLVVTDSGGIQEETTCLRVPCVTVRENTERPVTVTQGTNIIAGTASQNIRAAVKKQMMSGSTGLIPEKWDGMAAFRIVEILAAAIERKQSSSLIDIESAAVEVTAAMTGSTQPETP